MLLWFFSQPISSRLKCMMEVSSTDWISLLLWCWRILWRTVTTQSPPPAFMSSDNGPSFITFPVLTCQGTFTTLGTITSLSRTWDYPSVLHITCHNIFNSNSSCVLLWEPLACISPDDTVQGWWALQWESSSCSSKSYFPGLCPQSASPLFWNTSHGLLMNAELWGWDLKVWGFLCGGRNKKETISIKVLSFKGANTKVCLCTKQEWHK